MAANGTKRRFAATTTLALPIMFLFAWSSGAWSSTQIKHNVIKSWKCPMGPGRWWDKQSKVFLSEWVKTIKSVNIGTTSAKTAQLAAAVAQRNWDEVLSGSLRGNSDDDWWKWSLQSCKVTVKKLNIWLFRWTVGTCKQNRLRRGLQHKALWTQLLENALVLEKILNTFHVSQQKNCSTYEI